MDDTNKKAPPTHHLTKMTTWGGGGIPTKLIDKMDSIDDNQLPTCGKADENFLPHLAAEQPFHAFSILGPGEAFSIMTKKCSKCDTCKPLNEFYKDSKTKDKKTARCKTCFSAARRQSDKKRAEARKKYNAANAEHIKKTSRNWYLKNKNKVLRRNKKNKARYRKESPNFKLISAVSSRIRYAIKTNIKSASSIELLGCNINKAREYLESKFTDGMSWDNHGLHGWHIDHIKPCASFDMSDPKQQRECFHYTNLQPLWAEDNLAKSDKII